MDSLGLYTNNHHMISVPYMCDSYIIFWFIPKLNMKFAVIFFYLLFAAVPSSYGVPAAVDEELVQFMKLLINKELEYVVDNAAEEQILNENYYDFPSNLFFHEAGLKLPSADSKLNIYALPVGQGDCTVIQCPSNTGGKISIIDFGSSKSAGWTKAQAVSYLTGKSIEQVILTHPDKDHINILEYLLKPLKGYPPITHSCPWTKYSKYFKTLQASKLILTELKKCCGTCTSMSICGGTVDLNFIASGLNNCPNGGSNGDSIVTRIEYGGKSVLVSGDFEGTSSDITTFLACAGNIRSNVYRLSHHGADNGLANAHPYLNAVNPQMTFVSAGFHTGYKHARCAVTDYLKIRLSTVRLHNYSCYRAKKPSTTATTKAMYATSIKNGIINDNYVIKFAIDSSGIKPDMIKV